MSNTNYMREYILYNLKGDGTRDYANGVFASTYIDDNGCERENTKYCKYP